MKPEDLIAELNLDESDETTQLITNLIETSKVIVSQAVNSKVDQTIFEADLVYQRAIMTLATQMFYDRTLDGGLSLGLKMLIENLQGKFIGGVNELTK
ncbi:head-tail connector protein [Periweissella fabalis]|uniref:Phage gp6-like head-tail connector protein n=1 Tax=Periweissella fabalis TaxID=1070421 RepID=A0A7X6S3B6_9LACO|nr:head-tail connector protein [Periweissella fabalis]MCM0598317.1 phage gp6-like head-tail connector protein [Periweissella fabalis]NKZ24949.1 phage gp6-like head-tail connector protein [Periweissella fabalis]